MSGREGSQEAPGARSDLRELVERDFDDTWYLAAYPEVLREIERGFVADGLDHYVRVGYSERRSPSADFDETFYLETNPDVARAVESGAIACGFQHFLVYGRAENRTATRPPDVACTVDALRGNLIDGWAANFADPEEQVELEFYLDDRVLIGRVRAETPRRDLLSVLPTAEHGFVFAMPLTYCDGVPRHVAIRDARGRPLLVKEGREGRTLTRVTFAYRYDQGLSTAIGVSEKLDAIAAQLDELRGSLDFVKRLSSFPLGDYDYYFRHFYTLSSADVASLAEKSRRLGRRPRFSVILPVYASKTAHLDAAIQSVRDRPIPRNRRHGRDLARDPPR